MAIRAAIEKIIRAPVVALSERAAEQRFICVDGGNFLSAFELQNALHRFRVRVNRADVLIGHAVFNFGFAKINFSRFVSDHDDMDAAFDDFFHGARLQIHQCDAVG